MRDHEMDGKMEFLLEDKMVLKMAEKMVMQMVEMREKHTAE